MNKELLTIPWWAWIMIMTLLLSQGLWMFNDAYKRGMNRWVWGFFGLLHCPSNLLIYLVVSRIIMKVKPCSSCCKKMNIQFDYCPYCGHKQAEEKHIT